jgi:ribonuclease PH
VVNDERALATSTRKQPRRRSAWGGIDRSIALPRIDGRRYNELRPVKITPGYLTFAEGSALIEVGQTRVLCAATIEDRVPPFLKGKGGGWVTAEYAMLPRSTASRSRRESVDGRVGGRTHEIQRLIGRSLRSVTNLAALGERTITLDCDVIQADGGTRTAAITGAYVALSQAIATAGKRYQFGAGLQRNGIAAVSAGVVGSHILLDLCYEEDSRAELDFNVVMSDDNRFVEVQGTAEGQPFSRSVMDEILTIAGAGIEQLLACQTEALAAIGISRATVPHG